MSEVKHTPGPWTCFSPSFQGQTAIIGGDGFRVAVTSDGNKTRSSLIHDANGHLIAAAPDLLAACAEFVRKVDAGEARSTRSYAQMKAAIAKATGAA